VSFPVSESMGKITFDWVPMTVIASHLGTGSCG
jgi:hypothetical protein